MLLSVLTSIVVLLVSSVTAQNNCGVPEVASNLKAHGTTNTTTHLTWDPPASTECADHYRLTHCSYWKDPTHECAFKTVILPLNTTQYDLTQLDPCRYNLIELYTVGASGSENYTYLTVRTGSGDPPKLDKVNITSVGADFITLSWKLPGGFTEQCYPGFKVCVTAKGESTGTCIGTIYEVWDTRYESLLTPCTEYKVSVMTVDGDFVEDGKTSDETYSTVVTAPQMTHLRANVSNHTAHVIWATPNALSLSCAANYTVRNCRFPMTLFATVCDTVYSESLSLNATQATVGGLDACASNYLSVRLFGQNGYSSVSELVILDRDSEIPAPSDAEVSYSASDEIVVDYYKGSNDCITSYRACLSTGNEAEVCYVSNSTWGAAFKNLDLVPCSNYTLHFTALGRNDKVSKNITKTFLTGPVKPSNQLVNPSPNSALMSWDISPSALQCGTNYDLTWYGFFEEVDHYATVPANTSSYNITGLNVCTEYRLIFSARGTDGTTSGNTTLEFNTKLGEVGPITQFKIYYISSELIMMDTTFPDNSEYCIDTYMTCWYKNGGSPTPDQCGERVTGWNVDMLEGCVNYTITINATTNDNRTISGSTTFKPGPHKVTNMTLDENVSAHSVVLAWVNPTTNGLCTEYIQVTTTEIDNNNSTQVKLPSDATSTTVTNLSPCTTYLIEVKPVASFIDSASGYLTRYTTTCTDTNKLL